MQLTEGVYSRRHFNIRQFIELDIFVNLQSIALQKSSFVSLI